jgi:hypothetical protein
MDYRNLYGIAAVFFSGAIFVHSFTSANALPTYPTGTSFHEFPYKSLQCDGCTATTPFLTVPSDKYFVLTTTTYPNGTNPCLIFVDGQSIAPAHDFRGFVFGEGRLIVSSNSTISTSTSNCYIEGYYAEPSGINLESIVGEVAGWSTDTILSVPSEKDFIITGIGGSFGSKDIYLYSNSNLVLNMKNVSSTTNDNVFQNNKAHLKIPAGTDLKIENTGSMSSSRYYIQGYYAPL